MNNHKNKNNKNKEKIKHIETNRRAVSYTHLDVYKRQPYIITKDNGNNTYEVSNPITKKIKGVYNQSSIKKFYEDG